MTDALWMLIYDFLIFAAEKLDLQLHFIDFNSCRKVTMTFDVTCLNW